MSTLNQETYIKLIDGNLKWLDEQPHSVEKMHIETLLKFEKEHLSIYKDCIKIKYGERNKNSISHGV